MKKLRSYRLNADFKRPLNYGLAYILGLTTFIPLILLNCRWIGSEFIFVWDNVSWYLLGNLLFLFPITCITGEKLIKNHFRNASFKFEDALQTKEKIYYPYVGGIPILTRRIDKSPEFGHYDWLIRKTNDLFGIALAPLVLTGFLLIYALQQAKR